mmetsp:Transcript_23294/g.50581  ORF Transcript_23294/g.50581 Transcript_23294/m.50581 type:complete len:85 (+) Transcript_23294:308-562(+)
MLKPYLFACYLRSFCQPVALPPNLAPHIDYPNQPKPANAKGISGRYDRRPDWLSNGYPNFPGKLPSNETVRFFEIGRRMRGLLY